MSRGLGDVYKRQILYKWLVMNYNQFEHYQYKKERTQAQLEELRNPKMSVKELRVLTDTTTDYKAFTDFDKWVLKKATEEITANTHYNVSYEKIKIGRSIADIIFHIEKKKVAKDESYKERQQDPVYLGNKETRVQTQQELLSKALQSEYTTILGENMLIGFKDIQDIELMADLQRLVYPLYDLSLIHI